MLEGLRKTRPPVIPDCSPVVYNWPMAYVQEPKHGENPVSQASKAGMEQTETYFLGSDRPALGSTCSQSLLDAENTIGCGWLKRLTVTMRIN